MDGNMARGKVVLLVLTTASILRPILQYQFARLAAVYEIQYMGHTCPIQRCNFSYAGNSLNSHDLVM